jgi:hypothetical protein
VSRDRVRSRREGRTHEHACVGGDAHVGELELDRPPLRAASFRARTRRRPPVGEANSDEGEVVVQCRTRNQQSCVESCPRHAKTAAKAAPVFPGLDPARRGGCVCEHGPSRAARARSVVDGVSGRDIEPAAAAQPNKATRAAGGNLNFVTYRILFFLVRERYKRISVVYVYVYLTLKL